MRGYFTLKELSRITDVSDYAMFIDTETARIKNPVPLEVAMIPCIDAPHLTSVETCGPAFHRRFNPECDVDYGAIAAHNILPEDVADCQKWSTFNIDIKAPYVVGHNVDFDLETLYGGKDKIPASIKRICTLALSRWAFPDLDSHKLSAMIYAVFGQCAHARELVKNAHGALPDAQNCVRLVRFFAQHFQQHTWEDLWNLSEHARLPTRISFGKYGPKDGEPGMLLSDLKQRDKGYVRWLLGLTDLDPYLRKVLEKA